ncbi:Short-chain dehydrogenase/reductase [Lachnellula occidentalis]|uniref:Short-chain dehydrogenase/reductase n=1 Tax=Lachnellula occidentalis TaxID=215460 RepID=A0A8H8S7M1_9HELO|nr:Short-chain dehydrogenase/reductase [Lachnellula occidentalis]
MEETNIIVITGANTGIGLETVKSLLRSSQKYHILLGGRNFEKARLAAEHSISEATSQSSVEPFEVDVESDESIQKAYEAIAAKHPRIDCLVNNAGACFDPYIQDGSMTTRQAWNKTWDVNKSAGGLPKTQPFAGYRSSKAGLNMMMVEWAKSLKNDGVKVWAVAPGLLATSLGGNTELLKKLGAQEPSVGGGVMRGVIEGKRDTDVGNVVREYLTPIQPW